MLKIFIVALVLLGALVVFAPKLQDCRPLVRAFGPPEVESAEVHAKEGKPGGAFEHAAFDALLRAHAHAGGVDYPALAKDPSALDAYVASLEKAPFEAMGRDAKLALLINAYNALTLRLMLDHWPLKSIKDIPKEKRWLDRRWTVAGRKVSLDDIEQAWIRKEFSEPRIHFALNCASVGCPPLRGEAYTGAKLEAQLEDATRRVHRDARWLKVEGETLHLTRLYLWYEGDFPGGPLSFAGRYADIPKGASPKWLDYDWRVNLASGSPKQGAQP